MKRKALALVCAMTLAGSGPNLSPALSVQAAQAGGAGGTTYYISSLHGDNAAAGTSESAAWETLDKLIDLKLEPGDQVLLEKGSVFEDSYIHLQDVHGTADAPIKVSSYGTGAKPAIHANAQGVWYQQYGTNLDNADHRRQGYVSSTILLYDVDFVEISDLELTNQSDDFEYFKGAVTSAAENSGASADRSQNKRMDRTGVAGFAKNGGTMEHVYLDNLYIHDVDGNIGDKHMDNGGIQMNVGQPDDEEATGIARYQDIKITNCYVRDVHRAGICVGYTYQHSRFNGAAISDETARTYGHTGLVMENNYVKDVGNDGIVAMYAYRPLVQNNVADRCGADFDVKNGGYPSYYGYVCAGIWPWKCKDGLFQYNEGFDTVNNQDGMPWDIDYSDGTVYQYNYSHNNGGGCIMFCGGEAYRGTFRYNISQNDLKGFLNLSGNPKGEVYNNVFYVDGDLSTKIHNPGFHNGTGVMRNNIFYNVSSAEPDETGTGATDEPMKKTQDTWQNNIFYGYDERFELSDLHGDGNISADPKFVDPGKAPTSVLLKDGGMAAVHDRSVYEGYKLQEDSPAINAGIFIKEMPENDFFGNPIGLLPDIGVFESDAEEPDVALELMVRGDTSMVIKDGKIREVPEGMTAGELKKRLSCAKGSSLSIVSGSGNQAVSDDAAIEETMKAVVASGTQTKDYGIAFVKDYWEYDPSSVTVTAGSQQSAGEAPDKVLDNDLSTIWHTAYDGKDQSKIWIRFDLGEVKDVAMVKYVARSDGGDNGIFEEYKVEVSDDDSTWTEVDRGTWSGVLGATEYAKFDTTRARYVKLSGLKTKVAAGGDAEAGKIFGTAAEIRIGYEDDGSRLWLRANGGSGLAVTDDAIGEVPSGTTVQELKGMLKCSKGAALKVLKADGVQAADGDTVKSGMRAEISRGQDTKSYIISLVALFLRAKSGSGLTVTDDEIQEVPKGMTVQELKGKLRYSDGAALKILKADGTEAADADAAQSGMQAELSRDAEKKTYTISVAKAYLEYDPASMSATAGSEEPLSDSNTTEGSADFALDNDLNKIWHTDYDGCSQDDVWIQIDLGEVKPVAMVKYVAKQSGGANGIFQQYKVQVSETGIDGSWRDADSGTWSGELGATEYAKFEKVQARYVKLIGVTTTSVVSGKIFGTAAEIRIGYEAPEE